jgi:hypothetical protein
MRRTKRLSLMAFCVLLLSCGTLLETEAIDDLNTAYTLFSVDGLPINPWAEGGPSSGAPLSQIDFTPVPNLQVGFLFNPSEAGDLFLGWGGVYNLDRANDRITFRWLATIFPESNPPGTIDIAMALIGDAALFEGDWLFFDVGRVTNPESILFPFSETRLGYLEHSAVCLQADPDFAAALFC